MRTEPMRLRLALLVGAFTVVVAAYASLVFTETAAVKVAIPPQRLTATLALNTAAAGNNIAIQHLDVAVTDTAQGTASSVTIASAYATGEITIIYACPAIQPCPTYTLPTGTVVATVRGHYRFVTLSSVTLGPGPRPMVAVRALSAGAASNVGPANISVIENAPTPAVRVFNPFATSGGVDGRVAQIVQQSDIDMVQAALAAKVKDRLAPAMAAKAAGMTYLVDGPPSTAFTSDHAMGDETPSFTVTVTGKQGARAFSNSAAQAILRPVLEPQVWPGYALTDPIQANYQLHAAPGTSLVITANLVGFAVPSLSSATERNRLQGLGLSDAYSRLQHDFPGSTVHIHMQPLALPWLPLITDHINLTMLVEPAS